MILYFVVCFFNEMLGLFLGCLVSHSPNYAVLIGKVTQAELNHQFHALGAGVIEEVRIQRDKGFGFVRYSTHGEAALAIQMGNGRMVCGKPIKVGCPLICTFPSLLNQLLVLLRIFNCFHLFPI